MQPFGGRSERPPSAERPGTPEGFVPQVVYNWPGILIRDIRLIAPQLDDESQPRVRACIHLGALAPADVRVAFVPVVGSVPDSTQARLMWSAESYHNDSYLYESMVPTAALAGGRYTIRVTPAVDLPAWRDSLRPIEAPVPCEALVPHPPGIPRAD